MTRHRDKNRRAAIVERLHVAGLTRKWGTCQLCGRQAQLDRTGVACLLCSMRGRVVAR